MPTYEYQCKECGEQFSLTRKMSEQVREAHCPHCKNGQAFLKVSPFTAQTSRKS